MRNIFTQYRHELQCASVIRNAQGRDASRCLKKVMGLLIVLLSYPALSACGPVIENKPPEGIFTNTSAASHGGPLLLVHYMPWYRGPSAKSEESSLSSYGGHWTNWGKINPTQSAGGKAKIFARQYPLTGPYHSGNTALLEYQASLMKIAGIDGVIFDWYGSYDANDFGENHRYTTAMVDVLRRANLFHCAMFEDNTLNMMGKSGDEAVAVGKISFDWAQENWFAFDPLYVRYEGRPVVMCFGPQHFTTKAQWDEVFINVNPAPIFIDLDNHYTRSSGSFNWPPMWASAGGVLTPTRLTEYLTEFYSNKKNKTYKVASVFSAFDDAYASSYGHLAYDNGAVFDLTWKKAIAFDPQIIQIVTWNDYGEGTIVEPTMERGYNELEYVQDRVREYNPNFPFTAEDLRWPLEFYRLRYTQSASPVQEAAIKAAVGALFSGDAASFRNEAAKTGASVSMGDLKPLLRNE